MHAGAAEAAAPAAAPAAGLAAAPAADPWIHGSIFFILKHIFYNEMESTLTNVLRLMSAQIIFVGLVVHNEGYGSMDLWICCWSCC